ncbi:MAG: hypothetical protein KDI06_16470 [Calditrichaeota bacterium]|nr:hypothetical protein [Calditrichota bacterium]
MLMLLSTVATAYPFDGFGTTGIRRLLRLSLIANGQLKGTPLPPGGQKSIADISLNLTGTKGDSLAGPFTPDPLLQKTIDGLFPNRDASYAMAMLDITPGRAPRYAERKPGNKFNPGSVGKLAIAAGLFTELARLFPESVEQRINLLKTRMVTADRWAQPNHHEIPIYDIEKRTYAARAVRDGDTFSLYEWTDHTLSASSNAAASILWKEVMLMRRFGAAYPPSPEAEKQFFAEFPRDSLRIMALDIVNSPLRAIGISADDWQLGSFFTATGKKIVPGEGSWGNPRGILQYLIALERGKIVDEWSSLEIKRMMYMTARRIRYASSPALNEAAVFFKSGSLYRCKEEAGFSCGKYKGNVENNMNSVAIVEQPDGRCYMVVLMSNVLKVNSAVEHQTLATYIDRAIKTAEKKD